MSVKNPPVLVGAAEEVLEVPLFAELGGYGPFLGRRNLGVRDPLYCRVITFNSGKRRNVMVISDIISSGQKECRLLRAELAEEFALYPESILFMGTHTHSGACIAACDVGYGQENAEFLQNWRQSVKRCVRQAIASEEVVRAFAGKAPIRKPIGKRRTLGTDQHTDPEIRFVKFLREDGSMKTLLHNHAMHGVVFGRQRLVSADWMGDVNRKLKERNICSLPIFLYGTAGDVNVIWTHIPAEERHKNLEWISESYFNDLLAALDDCTEISLDGIEAGLKAVEFPTEEVNGPLYEQQAEQLLAKVDKVPEYKILLQFIHDRMKEMAVLAQRGHDFRVIRDLQVLKMGDLIVHAIPGEPFLAVGEELRNSSAGKFPLAVSVANGDAGYFPIPEMFDLYPDIHSCDDFGAFGFYEVWFGPGLLRPKFQRHIVPFLVEELLKLEKEVLAKSEA